MRTASSCFGSDRPPKAPERAKRVSPPGPAGIAALNSYLIPRTGCRFSAVFCARIWALFEIKTAEAKCSLKKAPKFLRRNCN